MIIAISVLIICLFIFLLFKFVPKTNLKKVGSIIFVFVVILSVSLCVIKPVMHKQFSINTIEYLIKIHDDGTMTTTKQACYCVDVRTK